MAKKRGPKDKEEFLPPKFGGFKSLEGLKDLKAKLQREEEEAKKKPEPAKPAPRPAPRRERPTDAGDDDLSFHRMMSGVVPLEGGRSRVPVTSEAKSGTVRMKTDELRAKAAAEAEQVHAHLASLVGDVARFEVSDDGKHVEGRREDVPPSVLRSLRRGQMPIDARLDLHGLSADAARDRVTEFLRDKRSKGERCVLLIHGKGNHAGSAGVLRGEIAAWLSQGRAREHVAAFATAREEDGGEGAVYVALRR